jgi:uncharacterized membrane protein (DUF106 family)
MIFSLLNIIFHPFLLLGNLLGIALIAICINLLTTLISKHLVDFARMKEITELLKKHQKAKLNAQKANDEALLKKLEKQDQKMDKIKQELYQMQLPLFMSFTPVFFVIYWLRHAFVGVDTIALLPFTIPKIGSSLGPLGWYILSAYPASLIIRRIFRVGV